MRNSLLSILFLLPLLFFGGTGNLFAEKIKKNAIKTAPAKTAENVKLLKKPTETFPRSRCFFGVHFDIHATMNDKQIGQNTTPELVNGLLDMLQPDFIQIDSKGHPGVSSYPSKVGNHPGSFIGDPLRVWRKITKDRGVGLFLHHSGIIDEQAIIQHPEWAAVHADGSKNLRTTSLFSSYTDKLLIPQILELAQEYKTDGIWIDGECWGTIPDYSNAAKVAFKNATGIDKIPTGPNQPNWSRWLDFHRETFRQYLRHYTQKIHQTVPDFQIASNWAFSSFMPEPICADVDYISGDIVPTDSVNSARFAARYMQTQNVPWDLMPWSAAQITPENIWCAKGSEQFKREAACIISQGGGFQSCFPQNHDGGLDLARLIPFMPVARFCRERQTYCFHSTAIPQVALILASGAHYQRCNEQNQGLFSAALNWQRGILNAILENHYSVEIYNETAILNRIKEYPAIVVCEWNQLEPTFRERLVQYVEAGGGLLLIGEKTTELFKNKWNNSNTKILDTITLSQCSESDKAGSKQTVELRTGSFGRGRVVLLPMAFSEQYNNRPTEELRKIIARSMNFVFPNPTVQLTGSPFVDVSFRRTVQGDLTVHLVNTSGPHATQPIVRKIQPTGPITLRIKSDRKPSELVIQPGNRLCNWHYKDGHLVCLLDSLKIYDIIHIRKENSNK